MYIHSCIINILWQEKAAFYRRQLLQKLGLVAQGKVFSTGVEKFIEDSDLMVTSPAKENPSSKPVSQRLSICLSLVTRPYIIPFR